LPPERGDRIGVLAAARGLRLRHRGGVKPDKRAVAVAGAAVAAGVVLGYWSGAVPGVLAGLASLVPAMAWQVAVNRQGTAGGRDAKMAAAQTAFAPRAAAVPLAGSDGAAGGGGVVRYPGPEAEVVPFWPRLGLDDLVAWVVPSQVIRHGASQHQEVHG